MKKDLEELYRKLDLFIKGDLNTEAFEQATLSIIASDWFEESSVIIQDIVYDLDNMELNELSKDDLIELRDRLRGVGEMPDVDNHKG